MQLNRQSLTSRTTRFQEFERDRASELAQSAIYFLSGPHFFSAWSRWDMHDYWSNPTSVP